MIPLWVGMSAYWVGALADWYTTKRGLEKGATEANGILRAILLWLPFDRELGVFAVKLTVFATLGCLGAPSVVFLVIGAIQFAAGLWNYFGVLRRITARNDGF